MREIQKSLECSRQAIVPPLKEYIKLKLISEKGTNEKRYYVTQLNIKNIFHHLRIDQDIASVFLYHADASILRDILKMALRNDKFHLDFTHFKRIMNKQTQDEGNKIHKEVFKLLPEETKIDMLKEVGNTLSKEAKEEIIKYYQDLSKD